MRLSYFFAAFLGIAAVPTFAHEGVKNPTVKARMDVMMQIGAATKVLGDMAKGVTPFDGGLATRAASDLAATSDTVPSLFSTQESDPKSEARPEIWTNFEDFVVKSDALTQAALQADVSSLNSLRQSLRQIGNTCKDCHADYRIGKD